MARRGPRVTRKFGDRTFGLYTTHRTKAAAMKMARFLRRDIPGTPPGYYVRVVKTHGRWAVYRKQKKRKGFRP